MGTKRASGSELLIPQTKDNRKVLSRLTWTFRIVAIIGVTVALFGLGYGIYLTLECKDVFDIYICVITSGNNPCTGPNEVIVASLLSLVCMIGCIGGHPHQRNALFIAATIQVIFGLIVFAYSTNKTFLVSKSPEQIHDHMQKCPHDNTDIEYVKNAKQCWETFQLNFCSNWTMAEELMCTNVLETSTSFYVSSTTINPDLIKADNIIDDCVQDFVPFVTDEFFIRTTRAYPLLFAMGVIYLILGFVVLGAGRKYDSEQTRLQEIKHYSTLMQMSGIGLPLTSPETAGIITDNKTQK